MRQEYPVKSIYRIHCLAILMGLFVAVAADVLAAPTTTPAFPPLTKEELVRAIEVHYSGLTDLTAKVVQKNFLKSVGKTQQFEGKLWIKRPGKLRLEYSNGQIVVIDGKEVWFYSRANSQAIRRTFEDFEQANIPVAFLLGAGAIQRDFDVSLLESEQGDFLQLVPKKREAAMSRIRLLADNAGRITRMIIIDRSGNRSDVVFADVHENTGIGDSIFRFKAPKGTEVIEQ
jgi:outer membrane lipoprotein carrier protein